jgi:hypothetical protein
MGHLVWIMMQQGRWQGESGLWLHAAVAVVQPAGSCMLVLTCCTKRKLCGIHCQDLCAHEAHDDPPNFCFLPLLQHHTLRPSLHHG